MRIKRIEIIGFKSFCDRTVINIDSPVTSVVGPNGCGKSNIVDAIRWCMGEQSARHLRGKAMDDVIFAGSESRGAASMAEVSLTFDDVGFSHETLQLALEQSDEDGAEAAGDGEAPRSPDEQSAQGAEGAGDAGDPIASEGQSIEGEASDSQVSEGQAPEAQAAAAPEDSASGEDTAAGQAGDPPATPAAGEAAAMDGAGEAAAVPEAGDAAMEGAGDAPAMAATGDAPAGGVALAEGFEDMPSASQDVQEFLEDKPPAFDFARYTEVTISRRLFRDGTSQYFINRTPCRLRDVTDFFLGTGVGTKAYSIIEQGRVGMIVSSRPQDRRAIIEEAAGITKFKSKKKAAERKLEQTRHNLLRVSDIVSELGKRMGALRRQAQKAERYRRYKAELRDIELWKAAHRYLEVSAEEKVLVASLTTCRETLETVRADHETRDAQVMSERAELATEDRRLSSLQEALYDLENRIRLSENKVAFQTREADELDERVAGAHGEIESLRQRREDGAAQLEVQRQELEVLAEQAEREEEAVATRDMATAEARQMLSNAQSRLDEARTQLTNARSDLARAESRKEALVRRREDAGRRLERVMADTEVANERLAKLEKEAKALSATLATLRQTRLDLGTQAESLEARREHLEDTLQTGEAEVESLRTELHRRRSRLQSLVEINDKYEGFARGTRAVMQASGDIFKNGQNGQNGQHGGGVRGLVADMVSAPAHLEAAVEAALGERLGGILVESHEAGVQAVQYLKGASAGRSAFVPLARPAAADGATDGAADSAADNIADNIGGAAQEAVQALLAHESVLGRMVDLVTFDHGFAPMGRRLLGDCVVVDGLERAIALHRDGARGHTLVTLEGDIVDGHGVVLGGSRDGQGASVLAQKREIRELEELTARLESELADATARFVATKSEHQQVLRAVDGLRKESHQGDIAIMAHEKDEGRCRAEVERLRERLTQVNAEQLELEERLRGVEAEDAEVDAQHASATERIDHFEREQLGLIEGVTDGRARLEELAQLLTEARVRAAQMGEKRASLEAAVLRLEASERELGERIGKLEADIEHGAERASTLRAESAELERTLTELRVQREDQSAAFEQGRAAYDQRMEALQENEIAVRELRGRAESLAGEASQLEVKLGNLRANLRALEQSVEDRYQLDLSRQLFDYHLRPRVTAAEDKRLVELKRVIERMGTDINLTAIDEYAEVSERHTYLEGQRNDLESAVEQLEAAIAKINKTSRKLFKETYAAVNAKFQEVYPRLFRGGQARLQLTGTQDANGKEVDILEAGVEIIAQPPGKKNSTVDQLSGGEKALTAVALIFSIFLIKPSPFCILDEVDAPLDDANVDRYNEIVREMTDRSQFIVITHNKRTMEIADNLYGVTMQEPGVSKLVSVNLSKIDERVAA